MSEVNLSESGHEKRENKFELLCGITLAVFAAALAITDLGGSKYGDDEIIGTNAKSNVYAWYQSKSIKQSLVEGQRDLITTLIASGSINPEQVSTLQSLAGRLDEEINRYKKEKTELLLGSAGVGEENWIQDVDGELGKVMGAREWERKLDLLGRSGELFDMSVLFLQLSLVLGAVSLVLQREKSKRAFYCAMILIGLVGTVYSVAAFYAAFQVS